MCVPIIPNVGQCSGCHTWAGLGRFQLSLHICCQLPGQGKGGKPSTLLCSNFQHVLQWDTAHPEMQLSPQTHLWGKKTKKRKIFMEFAKRDVNFLRWTEAKLLIFWEINILEHAPPLAVFLCGPGLPGIQSGRIHILTCVKRVLRKPSRRQEWDSTLVMFLCVPKNCCKPHRTG